MNRYILAIDQSTQGTKAMLLDDRARWCCAVTCPIAS